jgi:hypothetical protein
VANKGKCLNVLEVYVHKAAKCKQFLNEQDVSESNVLFDLVIENYKRYVE